MTTSWPWSKKKKKKKKKKLRWYGHISFKVKTVQLGFDEGTRRKRDRQKKRWEDNWTILVSKLAKSFWRQIRMERNNCKVTSGAPTTDKIKGLRWNEHHIITSESVLRISRVYSRTSLARTALGPWKFVRGMGSSSNWGFIIAPGQGANKDNLYITKTRLFKYTENFTTQKWKFSDRKFWYFFYISAQNKDCGYSLEPPRRGGSNGYPQSMCLSRNKTNNNYPCKPQFYYTKVGFKGVKII